jgi:hypothetical protein
MSAPSAVTSPSPAGNTSMQAMLVPLLTVELLLLAFFIVLNAVSSIETTKTRSVLESVRAAFGAAPVEQTQPEAQSEEATLADLEQQIAALARAVGAPAPGTPSHDNALWIDLPLAVFFRPGEDRVNSAQARLVERLAALLARTPSGTVYEVAVLRGSADATDGDAALRARQAGAVAAALRGRVEPRGTVVAGLLPDGAVGIRIVVSWRERAAAEAH